MEKRNHEKKMMSIYIQRFIDFCRKELSFDKQINYEYQSLSVCIIDCVYSLRAQYYSTTVPVVNRYVSRYMSNNIQSSNDRISDFIQHVQDEGGPVLFASNILQNNQRIGHVLKSEVCLKLAKYLRCLRIETIDDFKRFEYPDLLEVVIRSVKGMGDAGTNYLFMLAGDQGRCKPDVHIHHCVIDACGEDIRNEEIQVLFTSAVKELKKDYSWLSVAKLDGIIWRKYQNNVIKKSSEN